MPPRRSADAGTRRASTRARGRSDDTEPSAVASIRGAVSRVARALTTRTSTDECMCEEPATDSAIGVTQYGGGDDDDWCWRCRKPLSPED